MEFVRRTFLLLFCLVAIVLAAQESSITAQLIRYSGTVSISGQPSSAVYGVTFLIYKDSSGGAPLWMETHNLHPDALGRYSVLLGSEHADGIPKKLFAKGEARWIALQIEGQPEGTRARLVSVPYAMQAADASSLSGHPATDFVLADQMRKWESLWNATRVGTRPSQTGAGGPPDEPTTVNPGTANALAKFTDANTVGVSGVFENAGKLGIGTATPTAGVHISAALPRFFIQATTPGNNAGLWFEARPSDTNLASKRGGVYFSAGNTPQSTFVGFTADDLNYQMVATLPGDVGVGTTAPVGKFHVAASTVRAFMQSTGAGKTAELRLGALSSTSGAHTAGLYFQAGDTPAANLLALSADDTSYHMVVTSAGNVGVGTSAPSAKFDVAGNLRLSNGGALLFNDGTSQSTAAVPNSISAADSSITVAMAGANANLSVANLGVTAAKLADSSVTTNKIADASISAAKLQPSVLNSITVADGTITTAKLADGAVTSSKIAIGAISPANITGTAATVGSNAFAGAQTISGTLFTANTAVSPAITATNTSGTDAAVLARNTALTGPAYGTRAETQSILGIANYGYASSASGFTRGFQGRVDSPDGTAMEGIAYASSGSTVALHGITYSPSAKALLAESTAYTGTNYGVYAQAGGDAYSAAVFGTETNNSAAVTYGVYGKSASSLGVGVLGYNTSTSGTTSGIFGRVDSPSGSAGEFDNGSGGNVYIGRSRGIKVARIDGTGKLYINGGTQTGGADFAESVRVRGSRVEYQPGDVLLIDPDNNRQILLSKTPYATTVAGIYSTKPGVLGTPHTMDAPEFAQEIPVAMIGIVPCKASAENGPIRRGDLLVTSTTAGHVMRGSDRARMLGAIVGKALQPLDSGTGVIECMVTLQ